MSSYYWTDGLPMSKLNRAANIWDSHSTNLKELAPFLPPIDYTGDLGTNGSEMDVSLADNLFLPRGNPMRDRRSEIIKITKPGNLLRLAMEPPPDPRRPKAFTAKKFKQLAKEHAPGARALEPERAQCLGALSSAYMQEAGAHLTENQHKENLINLLLKIQSNAAPLRRSRSSPSLPNTFRSQAAAISSQSSTSNMPALLHANRLFNPESTPEPSCLITSPSEVEYDGNLGPSGLLWTPSATHAYDDPFIGTSMMSHYPMAGPSAENSGMDSDLLDMSLYDATQLMYGMSYMDDCMDLTGNQSSQFMFSEEDFMFNNFGRLPS